MLNLNLFRVLTPAEQEARRPFDELQIWAGVCRALGAAPEQLAVYENAAQAYATTTLYPNSAIVSVAREAAYDALRRGDPLPTDPEAAIRLLWNRQWADRMA